MNVKICNKCQREIPATLEYYSKHPATKDGLNSWCKECYRKNVRKWQKENPERYRAKSKRFYARNKNKKNDYQKERKKKNPQYHLRTSFSTSISMALKKRGSSKRGYGWEKILGYTVKNLMEHLEKQFTIGMTWDNYGKWHVDHIKPQSSFYFTTYEDNEFQECWKLENLQPLWAHDNLKKNNKINYVI